MDASRYLKFYLALVIIIGTLVAGFNYFIDPYSIFATPLIKGINANKVDFVEHLRVTNIYAIDRLKPDALIIGTSRAGRGFSPEHPGWRGQRSYNAALPGINLYEILRYLQHANANQTLKTVVMGLDFRTFQEENSFSEERFRVKRDGSPNFNLFSAVLPDLAAGLLSSDAVLDSLRTIRSQNWVNMTLTRQGQWLSLSDQFNYAKGFGSYTANTFKRYAGYARQPFDVEQTLAPFHEILALAHQNHIDLKLVILPSHAWHWEAQYMAGLLPRFEEIKRALVRINDEEARRWQQPPFALWDFSGYNRLSTEDAPLTVERKPQWFWEPVHFKTSLGDQVLARVFYPAGQTSPNEDFGVRLEPANVEAHLAQWRLAQQAYQAGHPDDLAEIKRIRATLH